MPMIGLVDGNNFFVSCERIFNLHLAGRPVAVLSNNDGCVVSRSNEFKALKIPMGTPFFQLRDRIAPEGLILLSSNYELYGDISRRMIQILNEFSEEVEQYSIDEAFIFPGSGHRDFQTFGEEIRRTILKWLGVPCGVGFAPTKTLAKIANHIGKKLPSGVFVMPQKTAPILERVPVDDIWGVGQRLAPRLKRLGFENALQLARADERDIRRRFSICLARTVLELRGIPAVEEEDQEAFSKSISCSRCFGEPVRSYQSLSESVAHYAAKAAEKLRKEGLAAAGISVYLQYYPEYEPMPAEGGTRAMSLLFREPTAVTAEILHQVIPRLRSIFLPGRRYKKSGVVFWGTELADPPQLQLFAKSAERVRNEKLAGVMDQLNRRLGRGSVFHLSEGTDRPWQMRRDHLSPGYTSNWRQLPTVFC